VRKHGSGNAGATNITRTYGKKAGILTFLGDGLKGVVSILIGCFVFGGILPDLITVAYLSAFMCIVGHVFPIFAHFQGGKGFATTVMCILVLNPVISVILLAVFLIIALGTKYISLGSVVTALCYPVFLSMFDRLQSPPYGVNVLFAFLIGALVTWAHRGNLKRIREGTERRIGERRPSAPTAEAYEPEATETDAPCDCARGCTTTVSVHRSQPKSKKNQKKLKKGKK
jgi:glycerol-3-phosphate acyltransferase PlsY